MGSDRIRAKVKKSSSLIPGHKPKKFSFLQPRYQDQVEADSVQDNKQQDYPTPALSHSFGQMSVFPIQAKLTIGQPNDKYEQEADRVASHVVQQINVPSTAQSNQGQSVQRMEEPEEEELQTKPMISPIQRSLISPVVQRMDMPEEEEELQTKPMISPIQRSLISPVVQRMEEPEEEDLQTKPTLQRSEAVAGGEASTDLDSAINRARGGGQPLEAGLQQSMGQAMGADFSGVQVHTDTHSDQLNQSLQAKAFTTGKDVFFRQGAYQPGSQDGQKLIAHELTHVIQQQSARGDQSPWTTEKVNGDRRQGEENRFGGALEPQPLRQGEDTIYVSGNATSAEVQTKRKVNDQELINYQKTNSWAKVSMLNKTVKGLEKDEWEKVYDTKLSKGKEKFGPAVKKSPIEPKASDKSDYRDYKRILRERRGPYTFIAYVESVDKNVVKMLATRNRDARYWNKVDKLKTAEAQKANADYAVEYLNEFDLSTGKFVAKYNFKNDDQRLYGPFQDKESRFWKNKKREGPSTVEEWNQEYGKPMSNSEIIYIQAQQAIALGQKIAETTSQKSTQPSVSLSQIERNHVINQETKITMIYCDNQKVDDKGELIGKGTAQKSSADYYALLGTPNGQAAGFIAKQHTGKEGKVEEVIDDIQYKETELYIPIKNVK